MPLLLMFPAIVFFATMQAMRQATTQTVPIAPSVDPAKARRREFRVIKGGQQVVLFGAEGARYRHRKEP